MGTYYAVMGGSRILNASRADQSGADDVDVSAWVAADNFIVAVNINSGGKDSVAGQYRLNWRDETDNPGGAFTALASTGECKFGATDLTNGGTIAVGGRKCDSQGGDTWQTGYEVEGTANSTSIDLADEYETEIHFSVSCADGDATHQYTFELYNVTRGAATGTLLAQLTLAAGSDACTADSILSGTPVLGTPTVGVKHNFTANNITAGTPALGTPDIAQEHVLTADNIVTPSTVLGTPTIEQEHILTADGILAGSPVLGTPTAEETGGADACTADNILAGTPVLGTPDIGQEHALTSDNIASQSPVLGTPAVGQEHALSADNIVSQSPVLGTPTAAVIHNLLAENIATGAPVISLPDIGQEHVLTATSFDTGNPVLGTPTATAVNVLTADDILAGSPVLGTPTAAELTVHHLIADNILAGGGGGISGILISTDGNILKVSDTHIIEIH